jgi:hypothetical protein
MGVKRNDRIGETKIHINGSKMIIVEYNTRTNILVKFLDSGMVFPTNYNSFNNGTVKIKDPYDKSVYGVGCIGEGKYKSYDNMKQTVFYKKWCAILRRCYSEKEREKYPTYNDCSVSEEWLNFQNFAAWVDENYYVVDGEVMHIDKDILKKGNRVYSSETCIFVPQRINTLFVRNTSNRGNLPIGVTYDKIRGKYVSRCSGGLKMRTEHVGYHNTAEEAFLSYKKNKELVIKDTANMYKEFIPKKLYEAMLSYKIEITD